MRKNQPPELASGPPPGEAKELRQKAKPSSKRDTQRVSQQGPNYSTKRMHDPIKQVGIPQDEPNNQDNMTALTTILCPPKL